MYEVQLYDDSPRRGTGVFDTSYSSEKVRYDAVTPVNVNYIAVVTSEFVFSRPLQMCEATMESTYTISCSALLCTSVQEIKNYR